MPKPTEVFGRHVITLRNNSLDALSLYLSGNSVPSDLAAVLAKLNDEDKAVLQRVVAAIIDQSIQHFLYGLDGAACADDGLSVTYKGTPLTNGDYAFGSDLPKWHQKFDRYDDHGKSKG